MSPDTGQLQSHAEFYLCLARAFLTPDTEDAWAGLREALADDLDELGELLGLDITDDVADYRSAMAAIPDRAILLQIYSALFIAPPRPVSINAGAYLDGALDGGSVLAMEDAYWRGGLERSGDFMDLSDHISVQLEFVASRYLARMDGVEAGPSPDAFLHAFIARWLPPFIADLERGMAQNPWLPLARVLRAAVVRDARPAPETVPAAQLRRLAALDKARRDRAASGVTDEDMAIIERRLRENGLAVDHLSIPPELRDEARGLSRKVPPSPRRGSRLG